RAPPARAHVIGWGHAEPALKTGEHPQPTAPAADEPRVPSMQANSPTLKLVHSDDGSADARRAAMLEAALDCIVTMDASGRIVDFNAAAERTFGYRREEVQGESLGGLLVPPEL